MKQVRVTFGPGNTVELSFPASANVGDIVNDPRVRSALGTPANVRARINALEMPNHAPVGDGDTIQLETVGTSKA